MSDELLWVSKLGELKRSTASTLKQIFQSGEEEPPAVRAALPSLLTDSAVAELQTLRKSVAERQMHAVEQEQNYQRKLQKLNSKLAKLEEELNLLSNSAEMTNQEVQKELKPLLVTRAKYATVLGLEAHVTNADEHQLVARVKFSPKQDAKSLQVTINRQNNAVTAFNVSELMPPLEAAELQRLVIDGHGVVDMRKLISKVRPLCL